jgi:quercetin dioxygenase-like cupin family protein
LGKIYGHFVKRKVYPLQRNVANPSINSLKKISDALDTQLATFFVEDNNDQDNEKDYIVRASKRKKLAYPGSKAEMYLLSPDLNNNIELIMIVAEPGGQSGDDNYFHEGEECGYIIQGSLEIELNGEVFTLNEGDSMQFKSKIPHKWKNKGSKISISVWSITPPSY